MPEITLVTGGAGFIGSHIARALLARGERVRIVDDFSTGKRANLAGLEAAELVEGDLTEPEICTRACEGVTWVYHQAAIPSVPRSIRNPRETHAACATATLNLLCAARDARVRRVVYAGSSSAYGNTPTLPKVENMPTAPLSPYAVAKLAGEQYCRVFHSCNGLETVTLRYFNVFGPNQDPASPYSGAIAVFISRMLAGEPCTINGDGETSRDFTFIDNVVSANLLARESSAAPGQVYNIGTGNRVTLNWLHKTLAGMIPASKPAVCGPERPGDVRHSLADISAARRDLGYEPHMDTVSGLRKTVAWYQAQLTRATAAGY